MIVLIVGLGSIAQKHIQALSEIDVNITIYALRSSLNSKSFPDIINLYSLDELLNLQIDFAIISNPTSKHKDTVLSLLPFKYPLFIEKPIYYNLEIGSILEEIRNKSILTYVACNLRFLDCIIFVRSEVLKNIKRINEINIYCGSYLPEWRNSNFRESYSVIPELGGGVNIDLIHEFDYLYWLFGVPESVQSCLRNNSSLNIKAIDYANYCLDYKTFCSNITLNYYRRDPKRTLEIVFEDETWLADLLSNTITCNNRTIFSSPQRIQDTYYLQMKYFVNLVKSNLTKSDNTIHDAYEVLKICLNS